MFPKEVRAVLSRLDSSGFSAYIVGGSIRNMLMGRAPNDWDIATSAPPADIAALFYDKKVLETGAKHGTVTVLLDDMPIEVTTFRQDGEYADNRRPESVAFVKNIGDDLARRDFTINAMAISADKTIIDPFGGRADIKKRIIRAVGEPALRFEEDALRIMRALRLSSELEFEVEARTHAAMLKNSHLLRNISAERIQAELTKLLCGAGVENVLRRFAPIIHEIIPETKKMSGFNQNNPHHEFDVYEHTIRAVSAVAPTPVLRLAALLHDVGKPDTYSVDALGVGHFYGHSKKSSDMAEKILKRLKYSNEIIGRVITLVYRHDLIFPPEEKYVLRWLSRLGEPAFRELVELKKADAAAKGAPDEKRGQYLNSLSRILEDAVVKNKCYSLKTLAVNGDDLLGAGAPGGKILGETLERLLNAVIDGSCENQKEALLALARKMLGL